MTLSPESELACRELVELVTDYLEGALSPEERRRFAAHLSSCDGCVAYVDQLRQLLRLARGLGRRLDERALSPEARAALLAAFRGLRWPEHGAGPWRATPRAPRGRP